MHSGCKTTKAAEHSADWRACVADPQWALQHIEEFACGATPALIGPGWEYQQGTGEAYGVSYGWGNNELQYYTNKCAVPISDMRLTYFG